MCRHRALEGTLSDVSPIHWQYGAIARLKKGETIDPLQIIPHIRDLHVRDGSAGRNYLELAFELEFAERVDQVTKLMTGVSHTNPKGLDFALRIMKRLRRATDTWKEETGIGFGLYGTPAESLCYPSKQSDSRSSSSCQNSSSSPCARMPICGRLRLTTPWLKRPSN